MNQKNKVQITVDLENYQEARLDKWLSLNLENISRTQITDLIDRGLILVNSKNEKTSYKVKINDKIEITLPDLVTTELKPAEIDLEILFQDDDLLVVNKPSGLVVHPAAGHQDDTLVNALLFHVDHLSMKNEKRPGIVHRIDKETSGLLVVAKNDYTHEKLSEQFKKKTTHRIYYAVVEGKLRQAQGTVQSYLARHVNDRKKYSSLRENGKIIQKWRGDIDHAKWAITHYQCLQSVDQQKHLVRLQLETGRTHQIRIHLSEQGLVIVGDLLYGYNSKKYQAEDLKRFYLHAAELGFAHPRTQQNMMFKTPWPSEDLIRLKNWGFDVDL